MQVDGSIRIGLSSIDAAWRAGGRSAPWRGRGQFAPGDSAQVQQRYQEVGTALGQLLEAMPAKLRLFSPHMRVMLADPYLHLAVIRFSQLPRSRQDMELLVTQRFCRDHKMEPSATTFAHALQGEMQGERYVLVCALNAALAGNISGRLGAHRLHADIITAESIYAIRALSFAVSLSAPSLLLLLYGDYATIVLWSGPGIASHIGVFQQGGRSRVEFLRALRVRLERYAAASGGDARALSVDVVADDEGEAAAFHDLPYAVRDLRRHPAILRAWPASRPVWETIVEAGG